MSDYLNEEEQIARMKSWWDENGTATIIIVVLALAGTIGWRWYGGHTEQQAYAASEAFASYQSAPEGSKAEFGAKVAEDFPGSAYHVFVLFDQVKQAVGESDLSKAEGLLNEAIAVAKDDLLIDLAKVRLAKVQQGLDRSADALATLESLSSQGYQAWGLEAKGDIHVAQGELELAHAAYKAASDLLEAGDDRPVLQMKLNNVAPFEGQYVEFDSTLESALQEAQATIDQANIDQAAENVAIEAEALVQDADQASQEAADAVEEAVQAVQQATSEQPDGE